MMTRRNRMDAKIIAAASRQYAEHGFDNRKRLRERVLAQLFAGRWKPEWDALLVDRRLPLDERLTRFYTQYRGKIQRAEARLWTRAGLLGRHGPAFSRTLEKRILIPVVRELRHAAGVPSRRAASRKEIELVQMLHGAIAFPHTRSYIFDMNVYGRLPDLVAMMVRVWLPGAIQEERRLSRRLRR